MRQVLAMHITKYLKSSLNGYCMIHYTHTTKLCIKLLFWHVPYNLLRQLLPATCHFQQKHNSLFHKSRRTMDKSTSAPQVNNNVQTKQAHSLRTWPTTQWVTAKTRSRIKQSRNNKKKYKSITFNVILTSFFFFLVNAKTWRLVIFLEVVVIQIPRSEEYVISVAQNCSVVNGELLYLSMDFHSITVEFGRRKDTLILIYIVDASAWLMALIAQRLWHIKRAYLQLDTCWQGCEKKKNK